MGDADMGRAAWQLRKRSIIDKRPSRDECLGETCWAWVWGLRLKDLETVPGAKQCGTGWLLDSFRRSCRVMDRGPIDASSEYHPSHDTHFSRVCAVARTICTAA